MTIYDVLKIFRNDAFRTERGKGEKFEKLMQRWLLTDPTYSNIFTKVWMWKDSPCVDSMGKTDLGIDLVALDDKGGYWAIQCKCLDGEKSIPKEKVDSFLSNSDSSREFVVDSKKCKFSNRMWISTTYKFGKNAEKAFDNLNPQVVKVNLNTLNESQVDWELLLKGKNGAEALRKKATPLEHQQPIIEAALNHFKENERGTLVMACGTGKTLTSMFITQQMLNNKGLVLFLAPSIALVGQSLNSWFANSEKPIKAVCICSDNSAGALSYNDEDDIMQESLADLPIRSCTNPNAVVEEIERYKNHDGLLVCFSTYQSIDVVERAQKILLKKYNNKFGNFDFIICDEAHRTASVKVSGKDITDFVKIHDGSFIKGTHRMYMTATPKVYQEGSKSKATLNDDVLFSMDDEKVFGKHFYTLGFGSAVQKGLLTDYKVLVLTIDEGQANSEFLEAYKQYVETEKKKGKFIEQITPQQQAMILGSVSAMSKQLLYANQDDFAEDEDMKKPMHTAIAFCDNVRRTTRTKKGVYVAEEITEAFESVTRIYKEVLGNDADSQDFIEDLVDVKSEMVSGDMPTNERNENLRILREHFDDEEKRSNIVCNVNCLSEGVDVPALDAAIFLASKKSVITIVQSVGRVMRKFVGKKYGYIIIPVVIPIGADANAEMDKNERYKLIWNILNAMRSHDERLAAELSNHNYTHVKVVSPASPRSYTRYGSGRGSGSGTSRHGKSGKKTSPGGGTEEPTLNIPLEFVDKLYARMVDKVGERMYWEKWSSKVGTIAHSFMGRLKELIAKGKYVREIDKFVKDLQMNINPSIDREQALQFLAQQLVTRPVFDALFPDYQFTKNNTVSRSIQIILDKVKQEAFVKDLEVLDKFYDEVSQVCGTLRTIEEKQDTIKTLYEKFFAKGISTELHMVEQFGIVYTPIECVDFIIKSVDDVLKKEFHTSLKDRGVNILDPFTGTGTFITQTLNYLYKHGISSEDLEYKYKNEIHCNEIVLLSYYIADVNIESVFNDIVKRKDYIPYNNICLTDTFQLAESKQGALKIDGYFKENTAQINRQKKLPIRVIIGNPPYSVGQKKANDNAQNMDYPALNERISETYAKGTTATNKNSLYNSYIKAFRWASDRIRQNENQGGIVAFISPNSWLDGSAAYGFRTCLESEFTDIYVYNLRGNCDSSGELRKKEAGNVFGSGSKTPIAITILVNNPDKPKSLRRTKLFNSEGNQHSLPLEYYVADIHYLDIGDYLSRDDKLKKIKETSSVLSKKFGDTIIIPNDKGDWINQRGNVFEEMILIGDKEDKNKTNTWFNPIYSRGLATARDAWCYCFSKEQLEKQIKFSIDFYNQQRKMFAIEKRKNPKTAAKDFVKYDATKLSWNRGILNYCDKNKPIVFETSSIRSFIYRPFVKEHGYFNVAMNDMTYQLDKLFPTPNHKNIVICTKGVGDRDFSCLITDCIPDLQVNFNGQCFPLYWYESKDEYNKRMHKQDTSGMADLFAGEMAYENADFDTYGYVRHDGVTDYILKEIKKRYGLSAKSNDISKEDVFYYVYGILHSKEYRETFTFDLRKSLPRIPIVETAVEFKAFMEAGRKLAALHLNYEQVEPCSQVTITIKSELVTKEYTVGESMAADSSVSYGDQSKLFRVEKMRFPSKDDKSTILYNNRITISNIPLEAYEYVVNGKSAVAWIMERYCISQDKDSLIVNDGNKWGEEHNNPRYIFDLLLSVINVSVQTVKIVNELPKLKFE